MISLFLLGWKNMFWFWCLWFMMFWLVLGLISVEGCSCGCVMLISVVYFLVFNILFSMVSIEMMLGRCSCVVICM